MPITLNTSKLLADIHSLVYSNAVQKSNKLRLELPLQPKIASNSGEVLHAAIQKLMIKYAYGFEKLGKPIACDITDSSGLLDTA